MGIIAFDSHKRYTWARIEDVELQENALDNQHAFRDDKWGVTSKMGWGGEYPISNNE